MAKPRVALFHWRAGEARERAGHLRRAGYTVLVHADPEVMELHQLLERPPSAVVIDLSRLPSQGLGVATLLRQRKRTRSVPILFIEGDPDKTARARKALPDAGYATWRGVRGALTRIMAQPVTAPVVPGTMDGYSGTPLPKKLGIKAGSSVALLAAPEDFDRLLAPLPEGVTLQRSARGRAAVVVLFARSLAELRRRFPPASRAVAEGGRIWLAWPKRASGITTDLTPAGVRAYGLAEGFVDYKICAIDKTWSGLCFSRRRPRATR